MEQQPRRLEGAQIAHHVRCLGCGSTYLKPSGGGTVGRNPGCPRCGYLGWITEAVATAAPVHRRFAVDRLLPRSDQPH